MALKTVPITVEFLKKIWSILSETVQRSFYQNKIYNTQLK